MAVAEAEFTQRTARQIIRAFVHDVINGDPEFATADVLNAAYVTLTDDPEFQEAAARDAVLLLVPLVLREMMHGTRSSYLQTATGGISRTKVDLTARENFGRMFEHTGTGYASILAMDKAACETALSQRLNQVHGHNRFIGFYTEAIPKLTGGKTVGETFSERQLGDLWKRHFDTAE